MLKYYYLHVLISVRIQACQIFLKYRTFSCAVLSSWISLNYLEIRKINLIKCPCHGGIHPLFHDQKTVFLISRLTVFDEKYRKQSN